MSLGDSRSPILGIRVNPKTPQKRTRHSFPCIGWGPEVKLLFHLAMKTSLQSTAGTMEGSHQWIVDVHPLELANHTDDLDLCGLYLASWWNC